MTYRIALFKPEDHHEVVRLGGKCIGGHLDMDQATLNYMATHPGYTLYYNESPVACGGTVPIWPGRWQGWALLNALAGPHMLPITRYAKQVMGLPVGRVEISVQTTFPAGQRWARLLGFDIETPLLRGYGPDGEDHIGYVRFNGA